MQQIQVALTLLNWSDLVQFEEGVYPLLPDDLTTTHGTHRIIFMIAIGSSHSVIDFGQVKALRMTDFVRSIAFCGGIVTTRNASQTGNIRRIACIDRISGNVLITEDTNYGGCPCVGHLSDHPV